MVTRPRHLLRGVLSSLGSRRVWHRVCVTLFLCFALYFWLPFPTLRTGPWFRGYWFELHREHSSFVIAIWESNLRFVIAKSDPGATTAMHTPHWFLCFRYGTYTILGTRYTTWWSTPMLPPFTAYYVDLPGPLVVVVLLAFPAYVRAHDYRDAWLARRAARRIAQGHCPNCDYDLRGQHVVCPECGREVSAVGGVHPT